MKYIYLITLVLALATLGSTQFTGSNLSSGCQNTLEQLVGNKDINACFPFASVAPVVTSNNSNPDSYKPAADAICGLPKCSDSLVSQTQSTIKSGCQQDIANNNTIATSIYYIVLLYSPTRDSMCFKNSTGGYCFIESLDALQKLNQTTTPGQNPALALAGAPKETVCTPCNKQIANAYFDYQKSNPQAFTDIKDASDQNIQTAKTALSTKCGADFINGQAQSSNKSDATSLIANRFSFVVLAGLIVAML